MLFARARAGDAAAEAYVRIRVAVDRSRARRQAAGKRIAGSRRPRSDDGLCFEMAVCLKLEGLSGCPPV